MKNTLNFLTFKTVELNNKGKESETSYGYRFFDDHHNSYNNSFETWSDLTNEIFKDEEIDFDKVMSIVEEDEIFKYAREDFDGIYINGDFYNWDGEKE